MSSKISLKQASMTLGTTVAKFKTAQLGGTMTPDEAIEAINPIIEMAATIAEIGSEIQESIPGEQGGEGIDVTQNNDMNNHENNEEDNSMHGAADHGLGNQEEDNDLKTRFSQLQAQFEELKKENKTIKEDSQKEKLAQRYAQLFPVPMRESKVTEFMARTQPVGILEAQVNEAQALLGGKVTQSIKQAQIEEGTFDLNNNLDDQNSNENYLPGGKY